MATIATQGTRACSACRLLYKPPHRAPARNEPQIKPRAIAFRRFSTVSRPLIHRTNPDTASRRLPVVIAELKDHGPIVSKLVFCRAATKEMIGTTLAFGRRSPTTARTARMAISIAWQSSVARKVRFCVWTPESLATATPRENATTGGTCRQACAHWPADANTAKKTNFRSVHLRKHGHEQFRRRHPYIRRLR
jgi:hypothetical protein